MRTAYLVNVDAVGNHNKFYQMTLDGSILTVLYGRVGARGMSKTYPADAWDRIYADKQRKGYMDLSGLHKGCTALPEYKAIQDPEINRLMEDLIFWSREKIKKDYRISSTQVTPDMIAQAEELLKHMESCQEKEEFNSQLQELFAVLPRRMHSVEEFMLSDLSKKPEVLYREYETLERLAATVQNGNENNGQTLLDAIGIDIKKVESEKEIAQIKKHLGSQSKYFAQAFRIYNKKTDSRFYKKMKKHEYDKTDIHYYYHGSRNENWYNIVKNGLILHPNAVRTGSMFGNGLYFANRAKKSVGYCSFGGRWSRGADEKQAFLAVYKVLYNNPLEVYKWQKRYTSFNKTHIRPNDALFAHGGIDLKNDEIIIYDEAQATMQYLIELRK